ncbi:putative dihydroorotate oxidase, catalytic subunit [Coriobacteriaceae bacterium BV3Ac1]|uniref:dihydroorotate dehydrogenase n=1 Tax=Olegusella massiliensis TaxID=1776381 RepID=UPI0003AE44CE|nr:dihydroorotate dehydrogenase [Olegusella massiliensis]ERL12797.1 putative dihydroorotate oxidase, catalytic subunit [Coriobacteriaceae bacterium BV3Ac1]
MVSTPLMAVNLGGIHMQNPVNTASGTYGFGREFESFYDVARLGAITCKGCAAEPWDGNPAPRMCEVSSGIMNTVGLQNVGIRAMVESEGKYLQGLTQRGCAVILQVAGHSIEEYIAAVELYEELAPWASGLELNISCPNIAAGGAAMGATPETAAKLMQAVRPRTKRPLIVKMAPSRVPEIARALEAAGADALSLINTIPAMSIDTRTRRSRLSRPTAGLSGPAIHAIAVRMVWEAHRASSLPLCGIGGITNGADAAEFILAGATAISVGTANLTDPMTAVRVVDELYDWAKNQGASDINELIGAFEC